PRPISPYGVTKLAGERLCLAYGASFGVPVVALRYFTVYGPRQRPDMAFSRFIGALEEDREIAVFGDGLQTRDFTFVSDIVDATYRAGLIEARDEIINVGGGSRVTLIDVFQILSRCTGREPRLVFAADQAGDVRHTGADLTVARRLLQYEPQVPLAEGLRRQVEARMAARL
ncbi:MAG: NAD-dependent epimerase/dehydratase family protein, partial [Chloroflexota bacterium]